jgi:hypothetical protein
LASPGTTASGSPATDRYQTAVMDEIVAASDKDERERPEELKSIYKQEESHFTLKRITFVLVNFIILMINSVGDKNLKNPKAKIIIAVSFAICMIAFTVKQVKKV